MNKEYKRNSKEDLLKELKEEGGTLGVRAYCDYKKSGVIKEVKRVKTDFTFDKLLVLSDGSEVIAWI